MSLLDEAGERLPHDFREFRQAARRPTLICGAGLSASVAPFPGDLLNRYKESAEKALGCGEINDLPGNSSDFYIWAERVLQNASAQAGIPAKLRLARALGLVQEPAWVGRTDVEAGYARHRVIARFAREELWRSIWSLNWDSVLERALEGVGFRRGEPLRDQPWLTSYSTFVLQEDAVKPSIDDLLCIYKPHGCVETLLEAETALREGKSARAEELAGRLKITQSELEGAKDTHLDDVFFDQLKAAFEIYPLVVLGWSISEHYLSELISESLVRAEQRNKPGQLSIVDIEFKAGHEKVAACYGLTKEQVFFEVAKIGAGVDLDSLFLWLQARFCLDCLIQVSDPAIVAKLKVVEEAISEPAVSAFAYDWADKFLPAWTRVCWRGGVVPCVGFAPHKLALDQPHEHVPWRKPIGLPRPDLKAAAKLLAALPVDGGPWNVRDFPGGLWNEAERRLVIPLPAWDELNSLAALKPLINCISNGISSIGDVESLEVLPLDPDSMTKTVTIDVVTTLKQQLADEMRVINFAQPSKISLTADIDV